MLGGKPLPNPNNNHQTIRTGSSGANAMIKALDKYSPTPFVFLENQVVPLNSADCNEIDGPSAELALTRTGISTPVSALNTRVQA
jgi:hypothetical protein